MGEIVKFSESAGCHEPNSLCVITVLEDQESVAAKRFVFGLFDVVRGSSELMVPSPDRSVVYTTNNTRGRLDVLIDGGRRQVSAPDIFLREKAPNKYYQWFRYTAYQSAEGLRDFVRQLLK